MPTYTPTHRHPAPARDPIHAQRRWPSSLPHALRVFHRSDRADTITEFAIVAIVLFTVIFGIIDCSRALYSYHFVSYAARDAVRYAIVRGSSWGTTTCATTSTFSCNATSANVTSYVKSYVPGALTPGSITVNTTWPGTAPTGATGTCSTTSGSNSPGCLVTVQVTYPYSFSLPFIPKKSMTFSSTASMVILQ